MKSTIRLSLFLLLLTQIVIGQARTVQKDAFVQSRDNNDQPIAFTTNKSLYPPKLASLTKNAIYEIKGNKIKFYVFEGMKINQKLIASLSSKTPKIDTVKESNDVYLDQNQYGVKVLRSGEYEYKTYDISGKFQKIITFEAILDVIPKDPYYFDFPGKNTLPYKDCYHTDSVNEKKTFLKFQPPSSGAMPSMEPTVEWLKPENTLDSPRINLISNYETLKSAWSFDLRYTWLDNNIENKDQFLFYKLTNINTVFRLKVRVGFKCGEGKTTKVGQLGGNIFIPPYANPFRQPNPTNIDVSPPS